jgi:uncharacterized protein YecE (DUF72 family)
MPKAQASARTRGRARSRVGRIDVRIGISGWRYAGWRGKFYPKGLPHRQELEYASGRMNSIEINGSFYSLQRPSSYQRWYCETPGNFLFAVKGARYITHMKKLRNVEIPLANFFASGVLALRDKFGPILWQLPPNLSWNRERLEEFFMLLPRDTRAAAKLAKKHDDKIKERAWMKVDSCRPMRYALEIRHKSFMTPDFFNLLRKHNIAFVFADTARKFPYAEDLTADFVYLRLHGSKKLYVSGYNDKALDWWANRITKWRQGRQPGDAKTVTHTAQPKAKHLDVFVYFDNDAKVHAPFDAQQLATQLGVN